MGNRSVTWFSALALVPEGERSLLALLLTRSTTSLSSVHVKCVSAFAARRCLPQHVDGRRDPTSFLFSGGKVAAVLLHSVVMSVPVNLGLEKKLLDIFS